MPGLTSHSGNRCVWVGVNRPDGPPHITPVWFVERDGAVWFTTARQATKVGLLGSDARVSVVYDDSADAGGSVAQGRAELLAIDARPDVIADFAAKYGGWDATDPRDYGERVLVRVDIRRWLLGP